jgi:hypothetical protein
LHVVFDKVAMERRVSEVGEPIRVATRSTADVGHDRPLRWKRAFDHLDRAEELETADTADKSIALFAAGVIGLQEVVDHAAASHSTNGLGHAIFAAPRFVRSLEVREVAEGVPVVFELFLEHRVQALQDRRRSILENLGFAPEVFRGDALEVGVKPRRTLSAHREDLVERRVGAGVETGPAEVG